MTLRLYNTLTRSKEEFVPIDPAAVRLYVCGPTVYDFAHIGNARPVIVFDVLFRLLRHFYGADHVIYARNVTDVDDKINARAERDFPDLPFNEAIARVTQATERQFHDDVAALGALPPTFEPRATEHIEKMRALIDRLVARGVAYVAEDHVLFSPSAMDALPGAPRYGSLARRSLDEMLAGARVDVAPYKRDPMDFVLWKPSKPKEPSWPSPAGIAAPGRPGWHIECSAMSMAKLLEPFGGGLSCDDPSRNTFDIHGGGIDLVFPHHENEIAQSCCAFGSTRMANFWMHNGFLQVEGEKMAKSLGNFVTIRDLLETGQVRKQHVARRRVAPCDASHTLSSIRSTGPSESWDERSKNSLNGTGSVQGEIIIRSEQSIRGSLTLCATTLIRMPRLFGCKSLQAWVTEPLYALPSVFLGFSCDPAKLVQHVFSLNIESSAPVAGTAPVSVISSIGQASGSSTVQALVAGSNWRRTAATPQTRIPRCALISSSHFARLPAPRKTGQSRTGCATNSQRSASP